MERGKGETEEDEYDEDHMTANNKTTMMATTMIGNGRRHCSRFAAQSNLVAKDRPKGCCVVVCSPKVVEGLENRYNPKIQPERIPKACTDLRLDG